MTSLREGVKYCLVNFFRKGVGGSTPKTAAGFLPKLFSAKGVGVGGRYLLIPPIFSAPKKQVFWVSLWLKKTAKQYMTTFLTL